MVLKSVAHSFGHSFTSALNYRGDNYVMVHLLRRTREMGEGTLIVNLLSGEATPEALLTAEVRESISNYRDWFPRLVQSQRTNINFIRAARMTLAFDVSITRPNDYFLQYRESPYLCRVEIEDDRGKVWAAEIRDWWYPEAGDIVEVTSTCCRQSEPGTLERLRRWWARWRPFGPHAT